ncbi:AIPR family protein [Actinomadura sp. 21ATH]|uniref:AIPR family protein n=1 Tax=Actinomadura sp. 21ATH TaxID=1735444 RepID=UPI0035C1AE2B
MAQNPDRVENADVTVRAFSLGEDRSAYAKRITETTNTQNDVSQLDFIALEPAQAEIRKDFLLSLGKIYVYKRGEPDRHRRRAALWHTPRSPWPALIEARSSPCAPVRTPIYSGNAELAARTPACSERSPPRTGSGAWSRPAGW